MVQMPLPMITFSTISRASLQLPKFLWITRPSINDRKALSSSRLQPFSRVQLQSASALRMARWWALTRYISSSSFTRWEAQATIAIKEVTRGQPQEALYPLSKSWYSQALREQVSTTLVRVLRVPREISACPLRLLRTRFKTMDSNQQCKKNTLLYSIKT